MRGRIAILAGLALVPFSAPPGGAENASSAQRCEPTLANQLAWTGSARQLITVASIRHSDTAGMLRAWEKRGVCWTQIAGPWPAWVGQRGISERKREGDRKTPSGAFGIQRTMYGVAPNPGVRYPYHRVVCGDWWVEDPESPYYNRFRHERCGATPPFRVVSEDMSRSPEAYKYLAVIDYNTNPVVPGRGSGIFLHVSRGNPTIGCVSLPEGRLLTILRWLRPAREPLIVIGTRKTIRKF